VSEPANTDAKPATTNAAPLAPPPKPTTTGDTPDYFNTVHNPFSLEPNVFEQSFGGNGSVETPGGRTVLPPVANITSPSPLPGITPGWQSLRAGPLSPAMLSGPTGQTDYFSESFRGFPTPNESSLRTGLTPGGGGSMFPAPSPNTQAIFNLQSAGVTPGTGDFQQAALRAAAQANHNKTTAAPTSQPDTATAGMDRQNNYQQAQQQQQRSQNDPYANHDVSSAANDLLSFASQNGGGARNNQPPFSMAPNNQSVNAGHMPVQPVGADHNRRNTKGSINSMASADTGDFSESGQSEQNKSTRTRGKKGAANGKQAAGTKRKADDAPKGGRKKGAAASMDDESDEDQDVDMKEEEFDSKGRKMTDEEKRKNFLERNRYVHRSFHL
jgi:ATF/CREB family transcription factor